VTIKGMNVRPDSPVQYLKGVGPRRARILEAANLKTAGDLLWYLPFRYEDRSSFTEIASVRPGRDALIQAKVLVAGTYATSRKAFRIFEVKVRDRTGSITVKFFNQPYLEKVFKRGQTVILQGTPKYDSFLGGVSILNPEFEIVSSDSDSHTHMGRIVPIYRRIGQLTGRQIRGVLLNLLDKLDPNLPDTLPDTIRLKLGLPSLYEALRDVHFPEYPAHVPAARFERMLAEKRTPAHQRLIFEEFFLFQLGLQLIRARREVEPKAHRIEVDDRVRERLKQILPFRPTAAQKKVLREIVEDLLRPHPMSRLLQGDVGSGKTIVALQAIAVVVENGCQACLMAPTELLAEQHFRTLSRLLEDTGYRLALLTSGIKGRERKRILEETESGEMQLLVGTHALIQEGVGFRSLAFIVIDEQHRFGVLQRSSLMQKGRRPDTLVMTATPIPRSLALTAYGDLSVSVLDELPPGRHPVRTVIKRDENRGEVYRVIRKEVESGRQVYVVYPLIEGSEKSDLKAAAEMAEHLATEVFPDLRVGLLHGKMRGAEKEEVMSRFLSGAIDILVSTTVIEVGIDVPNATVMVIEHAERFGLSQLHQLRGRIGRGGHPGLCILVVDRVTTREAFDRLDIMRRTADGFEIAEKDLEIRGPGEFIGTRQSGVPEFMFANIVRDRDLLEAARREAEFYVRSFQRGDPASEAEMRRLVELWKGRFGLFEVG
jgi:ATP-dependent DNA helicase RecG